MIERGIAPGVTHLVRALVVGGSELETLAITSRLRVFRHRVVQPARFAAWQPSIRSRFPGDTEVVVSADWEAELERSALVHIQFPFVLEPVPRGLDSVLELRRVPRVPTLFTVHAAVNVPVVPDVHYVFHTRALARRFEDRVPAERSTVCPSLVELPEEEPAQRPERDRVRILWVSRNEDAKFHPAVPDICARVLRECPEAEFRFVGRPESFALPAHERASGVPCPAADLEAEYRDADVFWAFPHPLLEETWCRTVTEAMGRGLPCVVAAHGAMREQVGEGAAGQVAATPEECAAALVELVRDARSRRELGVAGRSRARAFAREAERALLGLYSRYIAA
jgi:glycosyltransferase involved in cell wall biosynthesis